MYKRRTSPPDRGCNPGGHIRIRALGVAALLFAGAFASAPPASAAPNCGTGVLTPDKEETADGIGIITGVGDTQCSGTDIVDVFVTVLPGATTANAAPGGYVAMTAASVCTHAAVGYRTMAEGTGQSASGGADTTTGSSGTVTYSCPLPPLEEILPAPPPGP